MKVAFSLDEMGRTLYIFTARSSIPIGWNAGANYIMLYECQTRDRKLCNAIGKTKC